MTPFSLIVAGIGFLMIDDRGMFFSKNGPMKAYQYSQDHGLPAP